MSHLIRSVRAACVCVLAVTSLAVSAQETAPTSNDSLVNPTAARQQAQEIAKGDPARWYRDDSAQQTQRKEMGAALQEAQNACRQQPKAERSACMSEARATWQRDTAQLGKPAARQ